MPTLSLAKDSIVDLASYGQQQPSSSQDVFETHYSFSSQDGQVSEVRLRGLSFDAAEHHHHNHHQQQHCQQHSQEERLEPISFRRSSLGLGRKERFRRKKKKRQLRFCCFFAPWSNNEGGGSYGDDDDEDEENEDNGGLTDADLAALAHPMLERDAYKSPKFVPSSQEVRNTNGHPNNKCEGENNTVVPTTTTPDVVDDDESSRGSNNNSSSRRKQSILRFTSNRSPPPTMQSGTTTSSSFDSSSTTGNNNNTNTTPSKRTFLPTSYQDRKTSNHPSIPKNISFSPMARTISVRSHHAMTMEERDAIWWNKTDFEGFKRGNVIITKNIVGGGSEIWLSKQSNSDAAAAAAAAAAAPNTSFSSNDSTNSNNNTNNNNGNYDKWWHKYGHSRRGLEQAASGEEARQRQRNVRMATLAVLEEQKRQQTIRKPSPERIAFVAREYTAWAKDLALAAGESDADAVKANFDDVKRHSREFYLLKHTIASGNAVPKHTPPFMVPAGMCPRFLDANTSSTMLYRKRMQAQIPPGGHHYGGATVVAGRGGVGNAGQLQKKREVEQQQQKPKVTSSAPPAIGARATTTTATESTEAVHDIRAQQREASIAQRAAGFGGAGMDKISMAAVMSAQSVSFAQESPA